MSTISAGLVKTNSLTVNGIGAGAIITTNLNFDNLDIAGAVHVGGAFDVSGNATVYGATTLNTLSTSGATHVGGAFDVSGNATIYGTLTQPTFVAMDQLQDNTVMDAQSIYSLTGTYNGSTYFYPIVDTQVDVPIGIFTDSTNTTVSTEFLTTKPLTDCSGGKIYYYATDGTNNAPIDGTAGTPHYAGVYGNIGTPIFVDVTDSSAYKQSLVRIFKNAPAITDQLGNTVGGSNVDLHYSSYSNQALGFTQDGVAHTADTMKRYYMKRGWGLLPPDYVATDINENIIDANFFVQYAGTLNDEPFTGIEFVYGDSAVVPISINLVFVTRYYAPTEEYGQQPYQNLCSIGPEALANQVPSIRTPVNIPITSDKTVYGNAIINGTNSVYYDINKKILNINYVSGNSWTYVIDSSNFNVQRTVVHNMNLFTGSFGVVKPGLGTFESFGYTVNNLISCSPNDSAAMLIQTSPHLLINDETILDSVSQGVIENDIPLTDSDSGEYMGNSFIKYGNGNTGSLINYVYTPITNAYSWIQPEFTIAQSSNTLHIGQNPYSTFCETAASGVVDVYYSSDSFYLVGPKFNFNIYSTTPESTLVIDPSNVTVITDPNLIELTWNIHENTHIQEYGIGTINCSGNTEAHCVCMEFDGPSMGGGISISRFTLTIYTYFNCHFKGQYTFHRAAALYENDLYSATNLGIPNQTYPMLGVQAGTTQYGEGFAYRYISDHYDPNQQILRRTNEISICNIKIETDNGFTSQADLPVPGTTAAKFAYAQALWEVTSANGAGKEMAQVYSDYALSSVFLRNNSSIPTQYQYLFPIWFFNKNNAFSSQLADYSNQYSTATNSTFPFLQFFSFWSDLDETTPIYTEKYKRAPTNSSAFKYMDAETPVPFWPRDASGEEQYKLGSWNRNGSRRLLDASNNLIYNTATGHINVSAGPPVWTPSAVAYKSSDTTYLEDLSTKAYVLPVAGVSGLGVSSYMTSIQVSVARGNWNFAIAQFVPDGSGGSWTQLPSSGTFHNINNPGTWTDASGEIYNGIQTSYTDAPGTDSYTFDLSGLSVQTYNGVAYYPKLVCVNTGLDTYGEYLNISPARARYSGKVTVTPTFA